MRSSTGEQPEPEHVQEARRIIREYELRDGHAAYAAALDGGYRGYQAWCHDCDWRGSEFLRGDEEMSTEASRAHKRNARAEAEAHRLATKPAVMPKMIDG